MATRKIVHIDEEKCDGCGECAQACAEGAIEIVDGKARLISESYCDGLGACLGECPQDAITIEERQADEFDEVAVEKHLSAKQPAACPGTAPQTLVPCELVDAVGEPGEAATVPSRLSNWPVQLKLVPTKAPYFDKANLLIAADCVPFSFADFHARFLTDKTLLIGCPKLDSAEFYRKKLAQIFIQNDIASIDVVYMEVPCCFGLVHLVHESLKESGKDIPLNLYKIGIKGDILEKLPVSGGGA
ncbi:MAG TPA: 4Fe-4S binding protein [Candidatus Anoxymicrobiaceae bacterium]|jgi:Pyruvate/2-oxoacid:ferredoxin oxidoreductase delta subunit